MNKILFDAKIHNLYSEDYEYLQDSIEDEVKKLFRQTIQNPGIALIIKGFELTVSGTDPTKIMIFHDGDWGGLISKNGDIIETQAVTDLVTASDSTVGVENYVYIRLYREQGSFNKNTETVDEGVQSNIDYYDYTKTYDREIDKWEIQVYTQSEVIALTSEYLEDLIPLGSFTANGTDPITDISEAGRVYVRTFIQEGSIITDMISSTGFLLPQYNIDISQTIDDSYSGTNQDIEDDLNEIRTIIKLIKGTASWDEYLATSLLDADSSANKLHGNGVIDGEWEELEVLPSSTGLAVIVKSGKALVQGEVAHILPSETIELSLQTQQNSQVGDWNSLTGEEHTVGTPPTSFTLAFPNVGNLKITDKFNEPYPDGFDENVDYTIDVATGVVTIPSGSRIANELVKCYYQWGYTRYDIVEIGEGSIVQVKTGTAEAGAVPPAPTARFLLLSQIQVDPFDVLISSTGIIDARAYAQNVQNLYEIDCDATSEHPNTVNRVTYMTSSGIVDDTYTQWRLTTYRDKTVAITSTGDTQFTTAITCIDNDELWIMVDKTPWVNTITVEWESVPHSGIYDQSETFDLAWKDRIEYVPILITTGLSVGFHSVRVTVDEVRDTFLFYSFLVGRLATNFEYNLLYGDAETEPYKITNFRSEYAPLYVESTNTRKAQIYLEDSNELCTSTGHFLNYWSIEQKYPVSRADNYLYTPGGTPQAITDLQDPLNEGSATSTLYFTPTVELLGSEQHQRVGLYVNTITAANDEWVSIDVILHDSTHTQVGTTAVKLFAAVDDDAWNYWELDVNLTAGVEYHYHIVVTERDDNAPTLRTQINPSGTDFINYVEMYKPYVGLYENNNTIILKNINGTSLVAERSIGADSVNARHDQSVLDIMGIDLSNDTIWENWEYETYIGLDVATGRIKFPSGYDANAYLVEFNMKEQTTHLDTKSILLHGETRSIEDKMWSMDHDAHLLTVPSDGTTSTGNILAIHTTSGLHTKFTLGNASYVEQIVGICHSIPEVNKLGQTDPVNLCLSGYVKLNLDPTAGWAIGDTVYVRIDSGYTLIDRTAAASRSWFEVTKLGIITEIETDIYLKLLVV